MKLSPAPGVLFSVSGLVGIVMISAGPVAHVDAPPPGHTGGFGEPTCHLCHAEYPLDGEYGTVLVDIPSEVEPGSVHRVRIVLEAEETVAAGFQLSARTPDGRQAGRLRALDAKVRITHGDTPAGIVQFAHQTREGIGGVERTVSSWVVEWTAPDEPGGVQWSLAANSANGDSSPYGDLIFTTRGTTMVQVGRQRSHTPNDPGLP